MKPTGMKTLLAAATLFLGGTGLTAAAPAPKKDFAVEAAAPAMWRVQDADSDYVLFGTFHILPPGLDWRTEALNDAFAAAGTVYFEVDADTPDAASKTLSVVMTEGFNKQGVTLSGMLEPADAQKLKAIAAEVKLPFAAVDPMRPWYAFLSLSVQFIVNQGFEPGHGADSVLSREAKIAGKNLRFFETIDEQLAFFTSLDPKVEKNLLILTIRDWDTQAASFDDLFRAWASADVDLIDTQMNEDMREQAPEVYEKLIVARNKAWADELDAVLKAESGKGFVAVGAAHLVGGENSVPGLLKAKGYTVTRYGESAAAPGAANDNAPAQ